MAKVNSARSEHCVRRFECSRENPASPHDAPPFSPLRPLQSAFMSRILTPRVTDSHEAHSCPSYTWSAASEDRVFLGTKELVLFRQAHLRTLFLSSPACSAVRLNFSYTNVSIFSPFCPFVKFPPSFVRRILPVSMLLSLFFSLFSLFLYFFLLFPQSRYFYSLFHT